MNISRTMQWGLLLCMTAAAMACVTNQLTEPCTDAACTENPPPGKLAADPRTFESAKDAGPLGTPVRIATIPGASDLALDHAGGAVVTAGLAKGPNAREGVFYVPPSGGSVVQIGKDPGMSPTTDGTRACWVKWVNGSRILCSLLDGTPSVSTSETDSSPTSPLIHGEYLYWFSDVYQNSLLKRTNLHDGRTETVAAIGPYSYQLLLDKGRFFWLTVVDRTTTTVKASLMDDGTIGAISPVATIESQWVRSLAVAKEVSYTAIESNHIVWPPDAGPDVPGLYFAPTNASGGPPTVLQRQRFSYPPRLAVDRYHVYYTDSFNGVVYRLPIPTGTSDGRPRDPEVVAVGQGELGGIRVTERFVYWTTGGMNGGLMRLAK
ncbi:hypothetical protein [Pendulispora albinea]|uniref:Lipoprotein n=1 Tax=Pendulispora albinea TaxID=2741071 RepID=A0ABZ2M6W9_9BACT